jgi:hypothetical protein
MYIFFFLCWLCNWLLQLLSQHVKIKNWTELNYCSRIRPSGLFDTNVVLKVSTYTGQHNIENHGHISMPWAGFEPATSMIELYKIKRALNRAVNLMEWAMIVINVVSPLLSSLSLLLLLVVVVVLLKTAVWTTNWFAKKIKSTIMSELKCYPTQGFLFSFIYYYRVRV